MKNQNICLCNKDLLVIAKTVSNTCPFLMEDLIARIQGAYILVNLPLVKGIAYIKGGVEYLSSRIGLKDLF